MTRAEHLIEVLEDAERHPEWRTFDAYTLEAFKNLFIELRREATAVPQSPRCSHGEVIAHSYDHDQDDNGAVISWLWCPGPGRES